MEGLRAKFFYDEPSALPARQDHQWRGSSECEQGADLIVVGSRGLGPVKRLLMGSVSEGLVHHARCPVLVCPEPYERGGTGRLRKNGEERHT